MIAVALVVIAAVLLLTVGVVTAAATPDYLTFFGASIRTTSAQIFLVGAICTWALLAASWLLMVGVRRSRERRAELAAAKQRAEVGRVGAEQFGVARFGAGRVWARLGFARRGVAGGAIAGRAGSGGPLAALDRVDWDADTLVLAAFADRSGPRGRPDRQPAAEERARSQPAEE